MLMYDGMMDTQMEEAEEHYGEGGVRRLSRMVIHGGYGALSMHLYTHVHVLVGPT